ncbi:MAG: DUF6265 family protein [Candidatus Acidiferrales bacterium]
MKPVMAAVIILLAVAMIPIVPMSGVAEEPAGACGIEKLGWMAGSWEMVTEKSRTEEHWTKVAGGTLLGMSRTVAGGKTVFFEYLRVEARPDGVYYVAHPKARPGTDCKLVRCEGEEAVFENPEHDFPQRIIYRKKPDGSLDARIEGPREGKIVGEDYPYKPMKRD